jgi:Zn-dependent protease
MLNVEAALTNVSLLWLLTVPHEFAHAWVATRLGDDTPRLEGRVTLNPLAHVDWFGTVLIPALTSLFGGGFLGWGRPVVFSVVLAFAAVFLARPFPAAADFLARGVALSLYLALFNLLPVPPLDGSKLLLALRIPPFIYNELARAGLLVLLIAMTATPLARWMSQISYLSTVRIFSLIPFRF